MEKKSRIIGFATSVTLIALVTVTLGYAQEKSTRPSNDQKVTSKERPDRAIKVGTQSQEKNTKPDNIVAIRVTGPNDVWARASVIQGGALKVQDKKTGVRYAFFPAVDVTNKKNVIVKVCEINRADSSESFNEIESLAISLGSSKTTNTTPSFNIEVEAIAKHVRKEGEVFKATKVKDTNKPRQQ
jgi:hypothetical protein